jgi:Right handed beta helix region
MSKISARLAILGACIAVIAGLMASMAAAAAADVTECTPTGMSRDNIDLTAALINPTTPVTGEIDATGCNIGVYYAPGTSGGSVSGADIHGANYYGVVVNAAAANVQNSSIHDIGEYPLNGAQHGVGVFYTTLNQDASSTGTAATGTVSGNVFERYQKGGIVVNGPGALVTISGNTVTGEGPVPYTAQNGIQLGRGATGTIVDNTVTGNAYTGLLNASSSGILVFGGGAYPLTTGVSITHNAVIGNDMGVYVYNADADGSAPDTKTKNSIVNNTISNDHKTNLAGNGTGGYQAGIVGYGKGDNIVKNKISGLGYDPLGAPVGSFFDKFDIDQPNAHFHNNG